MKIELRKWTLKDTERIAAICNSADRTYISNRVPNPYTYDDAVWWLNRVQEQDEVNGIFRAIVVDGVYAGNISIEKKSDVFFRDSEIGYMLSRPYWSRGITTQAAGQICALAFELLDIVRITGVVYEPNTASRRVLEKNGFGLEGIMRNAVYKNGCIYNKCIYGLLKNEKV